MKTVSIRDAAGDRWTFRYGMRTSHGYFSVTGEMTPKRCRKPVSVGCLPVAKQWLRQRLPLLQAAFRADLARAGIQLVTDASSGASS